MVEPHADGSDVDDIMQLGDGSAVVILSHSRVLMNAELRASTYLKDTEEEVAKMIKHLGEKVPPHPDIGSEIGHGDASKILDQSRSS